MELRHTDTHKARKTIESLTQKNETAAIIAKMMCAAPKP